MMSGKTAEYDFKVPRPPKLDAGKNFNVLSPYLEVTIITSVGVTTPGKYRTPLALQRFATAGSKPGETMKSAPPSTAMSTCFGLRTVPAPTQTDSRFLQTSRMASAAQAVRKVISKTSTEPSLSAF